MGSVHNPSTTSDLFSGPAVQTVSQPSLSPATAIFAKTQRHILPTNLSAAIKHLSDGELDKLHSAVVAEQERRGTKKPNPDQNIRKQQAEAVTTSLSVGKLNAIRAAFKAGVKPSRIAREFGLSQSDVRKALAAERKGSQQ
jgi:hypothetical protein